MSMIEEVAILVGAYILLLVIVVKLGEIAVRCANKSKNSSKNRHRG